VCYGSNKRGHVRKDCTVNREDYPRNNYLKEAKFEVGKASSKGNPIQCWVCGKLGHISRDCNKREMPTTRTKEKGEVKTTKQSPN
jgi:hypothetical protein